MISQIYCSWRSDQRFYWDYCLCTIIHTGVIYPLLIRSWIASGCLWWYIPGITACLPIGGEGDAAHDLLAATSSPCFICYPWQVVLSARSEDKLQAVAGEITSAGGEAIVVVGDVSKVQSKRWGPVLIVNNNNEEILSENIIWKNNQRAELKSTWVSLVKLLKLSRKSRYLRFHFSKKLNAT